MGASLTTSFLTRFRRSSLGFGPLPFFFLKSSSVGFLPQPGQVKPTTLFFLRDFPLGEKTCTYPQKGHLNLRVILPSVTMITGATFHIGKILGKIHRSLTQLLTRRLSLSVAPEAPPNRNVSVLLWTMDFGSFNHPPFPLDKRFYILASSFRMVTLTRSPTSRPRLSLTGS